jgi:alanyl-tRNA synthetase
MSKKLYLDNPYQKEFDATVLDKIIIEDKGGLILDQTCFYPEGGGQPSDKGEINEVKVLKVVEINGKVIHLIEREIQEKKVKGEIDWSIRFDHMQQHTGQHILSQSFIQVLSADTLSFHIGEEDSTIDVNLKKAKEEDIEKVELLANRIIYENRDVRTYIVDKEEVKKLNLRKTPPQKEKIRIVEISDFDISACGGTHCRKTGEVGIIKIKKWEKMRDNLRFHFVCGLRALKDYSQKNYIINRIVSEFSANEYEIIQFIGKFQGEIKNLRKKISKLQEKLIKYEAEEIIAQSKGKIIKMKFEDREPNEIKYLALNIIKKGDFIVLFGLKAQRVHLFLARSEKIPVDLREIIGAIAPIIEGKGGGRPDYVEIGGEKKEKIEEALDKAYELVTGY